MANKQSFMPDEWTKVLESIMLAGVAVSAAEPSGLWGTQGRRGLVSRFPAPFGRQRVEADNHPRALRLGSERALMFSYQEGTSPTACLG